MGMSRCYSLMKCLLILFNIVFLMIGLAACGLSVWALWEGGASAGVGGAGAGDAAAARAGLCAAAAWGGALALGAVAALWGAARDAPSLLAAAFALLALCGVAEAAAACWGAAHLPQLRRALSQRLHYAVRNEYGTLGVTTQFLDTIQTELKCCGAEGARDWQSSAWARGEAAPQPADADGALDLSVSAPNSYYYVPESCCMVRHIVPPRRQLKCCGAEGARDWQSSAWARGEAAPQPADADGALDLSVSAPNSYYYVPESCCMVRHIVPPRRQLKCCGAEGARDWQSSAWARGEAAPQPADADGALDLSVSAPNSYYYVPESCCMVRHIVPPRRQLKCCGAEGARDWQSSAWARGEAAPQPADADGALDLSVSAPNSYYYVPESCCMVRHIVPPRRQLKCCGAEGARDWQSSAWARGEAAPQPADADGALDLSVSAPNSYYYVPESCCMVRHIVPPRRQLKCCGAEGARDWQSSAWARGEAAPQPADADGALDLSVSAPNSYYYVPESCCMVRHIVPPRRQLKCCGAEGARDWQSSAWARGEAAPQPADADGALDLSVSAPNSYYYVPESCCMVRHIVPPRRQLKCCGAEGARDWQSSAWARGEAAPQPADADGALDLSVSAPNSYYYVPESCCMVRHIVPPRRQLKCCGAEGARDWQSSAWARGEAAPQPADADGALDLSVSAPNSYYYVPESCCMVRHIVPPRRQLKCCGAEGARDWQSSAWARGEAAPQPADADGALDLSVSAPNSYYYVPESCCMVRHIVPPRRQLKCCGAEGARDWQSSAWARGEAAPQPADADGALDLSVSAPNSYYYVPESCCMVRHIVPPRRQLKCCGAEGARDWQSSAWARGEAAPQPADADGALDLSVSAPNSYYYVPESCCMVRHIVPPRRQLKCCGAEGARDWQSSAWARGEAAPQPADADGALDLSVSAPNSYYYVPESCCMVRHIVPPRRQLKCCGAEGARDWQSSAWARGEAAPQPADADGALDLSVSAPNSYYYVPESCCMVRHIVPPRRQLKCCGAEGARDWQSSAWARGEAAPQPADADGALDLSVSAPNSYYYVPESCCMSHEETGDVACAEARRVPAASGSAAGLHQAACAPRVIHALETGARLPLAAGACLLALHALALLLALALCLRARPAPRYKA